MPIRARSTLLYNLGVAFAIGYHLYFYYLCFCLFDNVHARASLKFNFANKSSSLDSTSDNKSAVNDSLTNTTADSDDQRGKDVKLATVLLRAKTVKAGEGDSGGYVDPASSSSSHVPDEAVINQSSVLFVAVSFILLMIISLAWLVFYYVQRFRYLHSKERVSRRLAELARKAVARVPVKTLHTGDRELNSEFEQCAICIEVFRPLDHIRVLPCRHYFHKVCIDPWLLEQRSCPMCKLDILQAYGLRPDIVFAAAQATNPTSYAHGEEEGRGPTSTASTESVHRETGGDQSSAQPSSNALGGSATTTPLLLHQGDLSSVPNLVLADLAPSSYEQQPSQQSAALADRRNSLPSSSSALPRPHRSHKYRHHGRAQTNRRNPQPVPANEDQLSRLTDRPQSDTLIESDQLQQQSVMVNESHETSRESSLITPIHHVVDQATIKHDDQPDLDTPSVEDRKSDLPSASSSSHFWPARFTPSWLKLKRRGNQRQREKPRISASTTAQQQRPLLGDDDDDVLSRNLRGSHPIPADLPGSSSASFGQRSECLVVAAVVEQPPPTNSSTSSNSPRGPDGDPEEC